MAGAPTSFRDILENRLSQLAAETETLFAETRERARRELADEFNQASRRLFQAGSLEELTSSLAAAAAPFAAIVLVFRIEDGAARSARAEVPLASAAALRGAIETRDPVVAAASPGEVSATLVDLFGHTGQDRVHIFPLVVEAKVPALVYAGGNVNGSALELLTQLASAAWKGLLPAAAPEPAAGLIAIAPAPPAEPVSPWDRLSADEQQIHLKAQRWARVRVAEMRLRHSTTVQSARARRNIYAALHETIDSAREEFRKNFFAACPSMVDYLHLELLRTLAQENADLLGKDYPGPLV